MYLVFFWPIIVHVLQLDAALQCCLELCVSEKYSSEGFKRFINTARV